MAALLPACQPSQADPPHAARAATVADAQAWVQRQLAAHTDTTRVRWQPPQPVLQALQLPDTVRAARILDLGAATGWWSTRLLLARPADTVYAWEADTTLHAALRRHAATLPASVQARLHRLAAPYDTLPLPDRHLHAILAVDAAHRLPDRVATFRALRPLLRPGGCLLLVQLRADRYSAPAGQADTVLAVPPTVLLDELRDAGYRDFDLDTTRMPYHYWLRAR